MAFNRATRRPETGAQANRRMLREEMDRNTDLRRNASLSGHQRVALGDHSLIRPATEIVRQALKIEGLVAS